MPEGRFLSKAIAHNEQLAGVSLEADYLFARCIPHLDRDGRMTGNPELIRATACPLRQEIDSGVIPDLLRQLADAGLVKWYRVGDKSVLEFPGFKSHQKGAKLDREAESRYPPSDSPNAHDLLRTYSGPTPDLVRVSEVEVKGSEVEGEVEEQSSDAKASGAGAEFDDLPPDEPPTVCAQFMPLLRELGYEADRSDGSILTALDKKNSRDEIEAAIRGLAIMRNAGQLKAPLGVARDSPLSMRILYDHSKTKHQAQHWWQQAQQAFYKNQRVNMKGLTRAAI